MRPSKRDELLQKALKVFYRNGFHATGMDMLASETGISKTSMYKYFRTKEDLILAVLRMRDDNFRNWFVRQVEDRASNPRDQLIAMFDVLSDWFDEPDFRSCMFIKASSEYQEIDDSIYAQSAEHKRLMFVYSRDVAAKAGAKEPDALAHQLMLLKEGAIVTAHMGYSENPAADAKSAALQLINQALGAEL